MRAFYTRSALSCLQLGPNVEPYDAISLLQEAVYLRYIVLALQHRLRSFGPETGIEIRCYLERHCDAMPVMVPGDWATWKELLDKRIKMYMKYLERGPETDVILD
jgi:hypothetical protein